QVTYAGQQFAVLDGIEVALQVGIVDGLIAGFQMSANLAHGVVRAASGAETIAAVVEVRRTDRLQDQQRGLLHHPITHTRNAQGSELSVRFGNIDSPHGAREVAMLFQLALKLIEKLALAFRARPD